MKKFFTIVILCISASILSQEKKEIYDKKVYLFRTYQDFVNNKPEEIGKYAGQEWTLFKGTTIFLKNLDGNKIPLLVNDIWGFKIDKYVFRGLNGKYPALIIKEKFKIFYMNGSLMLDRIRWDSPKLVIDVVGDVYFYSDDLDSKIYEINKLKSKEKENINFAPLFECLKSAKKRHSAQGELDSTTECIQNF